MKFPLCCPGGRVVWRVAHICLQPPNWVPHISSLSVTTDTAIPPIDRVWHPTLWNQDFANISPPLSTLDGRLCAKTGGEGVPHLRPPYRLSSALRREIKIDTYVQRRNMTPN